jgi:hypothetical protein
LYVATNNYNNSRQIDEQEIETFEIYDTDVLVLHARSPIQIDLTRGFYVTSMSVVPTTGDAYIAGLA